MTMFTWNEGYALGIRQLDEQHKQLVQMINDLHQALVANQGQLALRDIVQRMAAYTEFHFTTEEAYLKRQDYPGLAGQQQEHALFAAKARELKERIDAKGFVLTLEVIRFLRDWLSDHILVSDRAYAPFLLAKGVR